MLSQCPQCQQTVFVDPLLLLKDQENRMEKKRVKINNTFYVLLLKCTPLKNSKYLRDIGQVKGCRRRKNVLKIFGSRFLKTMQWGITKILCQPLIIKSLSRQLYSLMFRQSNTNNFAIHFLSIKMVHGCKKKKCLLKNSINKVQKQKEFFRIAEILNSMIFKINLKFTTALGDKMI